MSVLTSRPALRWALPAAALVAVIGAGSAGKMLVAHADAGLPHRSPQQLLMDVAQAKVNGLSGTIVQKSDLGLPKLPDFDLGGSGSDLTSMVNGNHTVRFWYDGPKHVRVSLQGADSQQSDLIRNDRNVWSYHSADKSATHTKLSADEARKHGAAAPSVLPSGAPTSLKGGIGQMLGDLAPTTRISTDGTATVAGRQAYELVVTPKDNATRVQQIRIAVDGDKHIPLRVQVFARGYNTPAFEASFTHVSFSKPDASEFTFNPPAGTKVRDVQPGKDEPKGMPPARHGQADAKAHHGDEPKVIGKGWTSIVVAKGVDTTVPAGKTAEEKKAAAAATKFLNDLPKVHGSWGSGRLLKSHLVNVLLTDDGRLIAGAVSPDRLYQAASQTR
ncbi:MAG: sigma-E factor regulatory protein RseB domain-containing protein [Actinocatenispora sp.]